MDSTYVAQLIHTERAERLRAEADADRLARTARRAAKRSVRQSRRSAWVSRRLARRPAA